MLKKFLWLFSAVVFLCCPLWAADKDTPQKNYWIADPAEKPDQSAPQNFWTGNSETNPISESQVLKAPTGNDFSRLVASTAPGDLKTASPTDICPFTAVCYNPTEPEQCAFSFPGGVLCSYQDPSVTCPSPPATCPAYPFQVNTIYVKLCNPGPNPCVVDVFPAIVTAKDTLLGDGTVCHVPGAMLCSGPMQTITIPPNSPCQVYSFPLNQPCCVDSDYFACLDFFVQNPQTCQFGVCTDNSCQICCDYWDHGIAGGPWDDLCDLGGTPPLPGNLAIWTDGLHSCQNNCPGTPPTSGNNHYKTWRITPIPFTAIRQVKDQFMTDTLQLQQLEFLSNPVRKIVPGDPPLVDTFHIVDQDDHLTWYRAFGRDTLLSVEYVNQFESTRVEIDSVKYLLLPAQKDGHLPYDSLDHYKAYRIRNPQDISAQAQLEDQFDRSMGTVENVDGMFPVYFLTPCQKENEPTYDMATHYVAYVIPPMGYSGPPRQITDQFLFQRTVDVFNSQFLLVPTRKKSVGQPTENCCFPVPGGFCGPVPVGTCVPAGGVVVPVCLGDANGNGINDACDPATPVDTLRNHFKTWRVFTPQVVDTFALVRDQFTIHDFLFMDSIDFLSNPVQKIVFGATQNDTSEITRPDDHLTWYKVKSSNNRRINVQVTYVNQFESTKVFIDTVKYFLLPTQKLFPLHPGPDSLLGHYTAYRIHKPKTIKPPVQLEDQFDRLMGLTEQTDSLVPRYFLTPAKKNNEPAHDPDTHYVAYEIFPRTLFPALTTQTIDQWGQHFLQVRNSEYLLVPSRKDTFVVCTHKPNDCDGNGTINLADIICDVNVVFRPGTPKPVPNCRCDSNGDGSCTLVDIIHKVNYVFRSGPEPVVSKQCCIPAK